MKNFRIREYQDVKVIECVPMREAGFIAAFSTRLGGVSPFPTNALNLGHFAHDTKENVEENRRRFLAALALNHTPHPREIITAKQLHSADAYLVLTPLQTEPVTCDALITQRPDLLLGIQTADCLPLLVVDVVLGVVAGIHAGWRGTLARITERTFSAMQKKFGSNPADCLVATGPAIGSCCFEVGADVREPFQAEFSYGRQLFSKHQPNGKAHLDLRVANCAQLLAVGIKQENIFIFTHCTRCQKEYYFSYRGEMAHGPVGRLLSVVGRD
jgi:hypothetical protein